MARYHARFTTVVLQDNVGTNITVGPGEGNFTVGEMNAVNKEIVQKFDRGAHDGWVETNDLTQEWSISIEMNNETQTDAGNARIQDWLRKANFYSGLTSVSSDTWAFKVIVTLNDGSTTSTCTLGECPAQYSWAEGVEGHTISISGRCATAPTWA